MAVQSQSVETLQAAGFRTVVVEVPSQRYAEPARPPVAQRPELGHRPAVLGAVAASTEPPGTGPADTAWSYRDARYGAVFADFFSRLISRYTK